MNPILCMKEYPHDEVPFVMKSPWLLTRPTLRPLRIPSPALVLPSRGLAPKADFTACTIKNCDFPAKMLVYGVIMEKNRDMGGITK